MEIPKPLPAALLVFEILRLAALAFLFIFFSPLEGAGGRLFPFFVYVSPNALFTLMALFLFLNFAEFKKYLPLYVAGKVMAVVTFYGWGLLSLRPALEQMYRGMDGEAVFKNMLLLGGSFALSLGDMLSIFGGWFLLNKIRLFESQSIESQSNKAQPESQLNESQSSESMTGNGGL